MFSWSVFCVAAIICYCSSQIVASWENCYPLRIALVEILLLLYWISHHIFQIKYSMCIMLSFLFFTLVLPVVSSSSSSFFSLLLSSPSSRLQLTIHCATQMCPCKCFLYRVVCLCLSCVRSAKARLLNRVRVIYCIQINKNLIFIRLRVYYLLQIFWIYFYITII